MEQTSYIITGTKAIPAQVSPKRGNYLTYRYLCPERGLLVERIAEVVNQPKA